MTDIFGCCYSVDVQHIQTAWWDPVRVYSYSDWEKYHYFSVPLSRANSHNSCFSKTRWEVRRRQLRQKKKVSSADWRQSCFIISETSLELALTMPGKISVQDPQEELLMSSRILALCWLGICQKGRRRCGPKQLHTASRGKRGMLATREGTELLKCVVWDCRQIRQHFQRGWTDCPWRHSRDVPSINDLPIKVVQAEVSRRSHLYSSLLSNFIHFPPLLL